MAARRFRHVPGHWVRGPFYELLVAVGMEATYRLHNQGGGWTITREWCRGSVPFTHGVCSGAAVWSPARDEEVL